MNAIWERARLGWLFAGVALLLILATVNLLGAWLTISNVREPWKSLEHDYLIALFGAVAIGLCILGWPLGTRGKAWLLLLWLAKAATVLGPMLAYEAHYFVLDAYTYHEQARLESVRWSDMDLGQGTLAVTWILQGLHLILPASYHLAKVLFAFVGLLGVYLLWRGVSILSGTESVGLLLTIGLFPGVLFWSSILGKDPVVFFAVGGVVFGVAKYVSGRAAVGVASILAGVAVASVVRPWMGMILLLPALAVAVIYRERPAFRTWSAVLGLTFAVAVLGGHLYHTLLAGTIEGLLERIDTISRAWAVGGAGLEPPPLNTWVDAFRFAPVGAFTALFRPLPGEIPGAFGLMAGLESLFLLVLAALFLCRIRSRHLKEPLILLLAGILFLWLTAYAFVSYQNLGTAVRFRAQILPVILALFLYPFWGRRSAGDNARP